MNSYKQFSTCELKCINSYICKLTTDIYHSGKKWLCSSSSVTELSHGWLDRMSRDSKVRYCYITFSRIMSY